MLCLGIPTKPVVIPVMLTKKERKKIRKQRRRELELEKQEKIRFGFIDKPEPKGEGISTIVHHNVQVECNIDVYKHMYCQFEKSHVVSENFAY